MSINRHYMERAKLMETKHIITRTGAEQKMAQALRKQQISCKQSFLLEGYEVEFWIKEAGLVIEVDGFIHLSKSKLNSNRAKDWNLHNKGYTVIRYENHRSITMLLMR